jgi:hypothetical protein
MPIAIVRRMTLSPEVAIVLSASLAALLTGALSLLVQFAANSHARALAMADRAAALALDREPLLPPA